MRLVRFALTVHPAPVALCFACVGNSYNKLQPLLFQLLTAVSVSPFRCLSGVGTAANQMTAVLISKDPFAAAGLAGFPGADMG